MHISELKRWSLPLLLILLCGTARADNVPHLIFLKDGFVLRGMVKREGRAEFDGGEVVWMPRGAFYVDDIVRRIIFSPSQVQEIDDTPLPPEAAIKTNRTIIYAPGTKLLPIIANEIDATEWNDRWDRTRTVRTALGQIKLPTHLAYLSPYFARIDSTSKYRWTGLYLTSELGPEMVRSLLATHPEFKEDAKKTEAENADRRFRAFQFYVQASWYELAEDELQTIR